MSSRKIAQPKDLRLDVAAPFRCHSPGDTIIGEVIRKSPIVSPKAALKVWLTGFMEIPLLNGDPEKWTLFNPMEQAIFSGALHLPENRNSKESLAWSFSVTIPTKPWADVTRGHQPQSSFVPFDNKNHPAFHVLPGSFRAPCYDPYEEAIVEYRLHALLDYERAGKKKSHYTSTPIPLRHAPNTDQLNDQLDISKEALSFPPTRVQSQHLLPGVQKTKKFFGPFKAPEFWFRIHMASPPVVQFVNKELNHSEPLPIGLSIITLKGDGFGRTSKIIEDIPQQIQINYVAIRVMSQTTIRAQRQNDLTYDFNMDFHLEDVFNNLENPLVIDSSADAPINLGNMFQLVLREDGLYANGKRCSVTRKDGRDNVVGAFYPDFSTFAIKHTHKFRYRINLTVAGKTLDVKVYAPVKITEAA